MLELLQVGHCYHPETVIKSNLSLKIAKFPSIVGLIKLPNQGYMLFDTGYAARFNQVTESFPNRFFRILTPMTLEPEDSLVQQLAKRNIAIDDIRYIYVSHFHADHIAGLKDFPQATIICSKKALDAALRLTGIKGLVKGYLDQLLPKNLTSKATFIEDSKVHKLDNKYAPFQLSYDLFNDGSCLAVELPGHAYGHFGLMLPMVPQLPFLVGDACWTEQAYTHGCKPSKITYLIMPDPKQYLETIYQLGELHIRNTDVTLIPSHCTDSYKRWQMP